MSAGAMAAGGGTNAAGNMAGGFLFEQSNSDADQIRPSSNTRSNLELGAANYDALTGIGFGDIYNVPGPVQQLIDQAMQLPLDEKRKRRGISSIMALLNGDEKGVTREFESVIHRLGLTRADVESIIERDKQFKAQQKEIAALNPINANTVRNRALAANASSELLGAASGALTGREKSPLMQQYLERLNRSYDDSEERLMLQGRFGGFNPALGMEQLADLRADAELKAIEQTLLQSVNLSQALAPGLAAAQTAAGQSSGAALNALAIASQQAIAANNLTAQIDAANTQSKQNAVGGAFGSIGDAFYGNAILNAGSGNTGSTSPGFQNVSGGSNLMSNPQLTSGINWGSMNGYSR